MAALLDCMGDLRELSRRRLAKGQPGGLLAPSTEILDYVLAQMAELAALVARDGAADAALLFRVPGQLRNVSETRTWSAAAAPSPLSFEIRSRRQDDAHELRA